MDPLSDVLRAVRLNGAYFYQVEAGGPWAVSALAARDLVPRILPDTEHLISYHILVTGTCWAGLLDEPQVQMRPGDVVVFPHGDPHVMSGSPGDSRSISTDGAAAQRYADTVRIGPAANHETTFVCGFLGCDTRPFNPLISALPRRLIVPGATGGWLAQFPQQVVTESRAARAGNTTVLTRMAELMFIEVLRAYIERLAPEDTGWLAGLRDPIVGAAIARLHEGPSRNWSLSDLARDAATSRTVLADRFTRLVGLPPMLYLTRWRMQLAAAQLINGTAKVAAVAADVGYDSEAAFSRAFKRETGLAPAAWRRARDGRGKRPTGSPG